MAGTIYIRQSSFADGDTITAALFNNEFNQLANAFSYTTTGTTGHTHDGTDGQGGHISKIGDQDFKNKIVADSTNNRWGIFVEVAGTSTEQLRVVDGAIVPVLDSDINLGSPTAYFKDSYIDTVTTTGAVAVGGALSAASFAIGGTALTATITELNTLDGITATTAELNYTDGVTSNIQTQLNAKQPLDAQLTDIASLTPTDGTFIVGNGTNFVAEAPATALASLGVTATATELNVLDGTTVTTTELNYVHNVTSPIQTQLNAKQALNAKLTDISNLTLADNFFLVSTGTNLALESPATALGSLGVTATATELNYVDGVTSSIQTQLGTKAPLASPTFTGTLTAPIINATSDLKIGGETIGATVTEINYLSGVTSSIQTQLNALQASDTDLSAIAALTPADGTFIVGNGTSWVAESGNTVIASLGVTATAAEINTLDGITATVTELNYTDGVTSNIQTQLDTKAPTASPTFTGTVTADGLVVEAGIAQLELIDTNVSGSTKLRTANAETWLEIDPTNVQAGSGFATYIDGKEFLTITNGGDISFYEDTGTTPKFFWDASAESLGIGTSSPSYKLHINQASTGVSAVTTADDIVLEAAGGGGISILGNDTDFLRLMFGTTSDSTKASVSFNDSSNQLNIGTLYSSGEVAFQSGNGSEAMRIDSSGNVGIGTTSPVNALDVSGAIRVADTAQQLRLVNSATSARFDIGFEGTAGNDALVFDRAGVGERMRIDASGNVGIGTSSPASISGGTSTHGTLTLGSPDGSIVVGDVVGALSFRAQDSSYTGTYADGITGEIASVSESSVGGAYGLAFYTGTTTGSNRAERLRIDSSGNVGIGGTPVDTANYKTLDINGTLGAVVNLKYGGVRVGSFFNTADGVSIGNFTATGFLGFRTNSTERMRIDASGNLLIGKTVQGIATSGVELTPNDRAAFTKSGGAAILVNRTSNDGEIINLRKDGTTVGSIGTSGGSAYIGGYQNAGLYFNGTSDVRPWNTSTQANLDNSVDLGKSTARFKDLYLSGTANVANVKETVYALTGTALDAGNGGIQTKTLAANTTFTDSLASGESLVLQLEAGASYTVTWPTMQWVTSGGNVAPTLTAKDTLVFWKVSTTLYGAYTGSYV